MKHALFIGVALLLWSCNSPADNRTTETKSETVVKEDTSIVGSSTEGHEKNDIKAIGNTLLKAFSKKEYALLTPYLENENSTILFAPYLYIDTSIAQELTLEEIKTYAKNDTLINWGRFDGTGNPITLSISNYIDRFVYDVDFLTEKDTLTINHVHIKGNSLNNISQIYPEAEYIHYYRASKNPELGQMDWKSLIFVLEEVDHHYYLKAVVHNEWTI